MQRAMSKCFWQPLLSRQIQTTRYYSGNEPLSREHLASFFLRGYLAPQQAYAKLLLLQAETHNLLPKS